MTERLGRTFQCKAADGGCASAAFLCPMHAKLEGRTAGLARALAAPVERRGIA